MKSREMPPTLVVQLWKESRLPGGSMIPLNLCLTWEASCSDQNVRSKLVHGRPGPCWSLTRGVSGSHVAWKRLLLMIMTRWWTLSGPRTSEVVKGLTRDKSFLHCFLSLHGIPVFCDRFTETGMLTKVRLIWTLIFVSYGTLLRCVTVRSSW